jgi:hypothetical protein
MRDLARRFGKKKMRVTIGLDAVLAPDFTFDETRDIYSPR